METIIHNAVHVLLALGLPPLLLGVIAKTKALFAGRVGPPLLQPYYDLVKLFQKGSVFSTTTTWVFRAGPVVGLVTAVIAVLLIPLAERQRADLVHRRPDPAGVPARPGPVLHGLGGPGHRLAVRGDGGGAGSDLRLPGGAGVLPGAARAGQAVRVAATGGHARRFARVALGDGRRLARPGPAQLVHRPAGGELAASPSTIRTRTWN